MAVVSFKCPNCDGELIFDPSTQKYKCEYCASLFSQKELDDMKPAAAAERNADGPDDPAAASGGTETDGGAEAVMYSCPSCGAQIVTDETTAATFCYYCHNPVVLSGRISGKYLPDKIIPFLIDRKEAEQAFLAYVGKKKFVPKAFFEKKQIESLTGVYFPYWLYDVRLDVKLQGDARNIRIWRTGDTEYTETKHYAVTREGGVTLSNLTEHALRKANAKLAEGVMPYRFDQMKDFTMGYLSGFFAERRDIESAEVVNQMQFEMRECAEKLMRETISGYNSVSVRKADITPEQETWRYVLFPAWTITYKGKNGKIYYYSMNGQTGKICGELPVAYGKVALVGAVVSVFVLILGMIGGYFI